MYRDTSYLIWETPTDVYYSDWVILMLSAHVHEGYSSQFVCLSVPTLVLAYNVRATDWTYQSGLLWTLKVFKWRILLKRFLFSSCSSFFVQHCQTVGHLQFPVP